MTAPDAVPPQEAIEALAEFLYKTGSPMDWEGTENAEGIITFKTWEQAKYKEQFRAKARAALAAAYPAIREALAQEIEDDAKRHEVRAWHQWHSGMYDAAYIVRGRFL